MRPTAGIGRCRTGRSATPTTGGAPRCSPPCQTKRRSCPAMPPTAAACPTRNCGSGTPRSASRCPSGSRAPPATARGKLRLRPPCRGGDEGTRELSRHAVRAAWLFSSAKSYGYSIGPQEGWAVSVTTEQVRSALGADGNAQAWTWQGRLYQRAGGRHAVLAVRGGIGASSGDDTVRRIFYLGGAEPSPLVDFGSEAVAMLRGVEAFAFRGHRVAGVTLEYRVPVVRVERGWRHLPVAAPHGARRGLRRCRPRLGTGLRLEGREGLVRRGAFGRRRRRLRPAAHAVGRRGVGQRGDRDFARGRPVP